MKDLYLIFKNLTRKPLRLFLTVFATFIAFMIFGTLTAFQEAFDAGVELSADDRLVVVNKINFTQPLPIAYVPRVRALDDVIGVTHLNWFGGYYQEARNQMAMFAVDAESFLEVYDELIIAPEKEEEWLGNRQGLIAGKSIADIHGWEVGQRIPINSNIFSQRDGQNRLGFRCRRHLRRCRSPDRHQQRLFSLRVLQRNPVVRWRLYWLHGCTDRRSTAQ